ncbi:MAG: hypothetical protein NC394_09440 [Bacteroides sp.]|nr:hypothetical protein [Bacteroides sp.]
MSSVNSLLNSGSASATGSSVANKTLNSISDKLSEIENDTTHSEEYKEKQVKKLNSQVGVISNSSANIANASNLINGMLGKTDVSDFTAFFGNDLSSVRALMKANTIAQNDARSLAAEIRLDKIRGNDTSDKEERLANLTESTSILNKSLNSRIDGLLSDEKTDADTRSVIDKIKDDLEANQLKLDKQFGRTEDDKDENGRTKKVLSEESIANSGTVIDQIKADLKKNQEKISEEYSNKA